MEFREFYRGVCAKIRFDYHTRTYLGELEGLPESSLIQADSYEEIRLWLKQAVDDHLSGNAVDSREAWDSVVKLYQENVDKDAEEDKKFKDALDASFEHRRFLR